MVSGDLVHLMEFMEGMKCALAFSFWRRTLRETIDDGSGVRGRGQASGG